MKRAARISDFLEELLSGQGFASIAWTVRLRAAWPGIVGPLLSEKTSPLKLKNGVLTVLVQNHAWAQELHLKKPFMIEQANTALGTDSVKDIRFSVGSLASGEEDGREAERQRKEPLPLVPDPEGMEGIADPETRRILRSIARRIASRKR
ncbi:MAG: DUF721 domain-containing protein [Deltaproteobacteria bacterium]|nr:DUF721 domain-containing protein [Deltaproteobacteria bacterium]